MSHEDNSILKSTGIMTIATFLSRVSGLLRTLAMAYALGNTLITSAYQVANSMPNVIFDLVAGGILGTAFLPVYLLQREKQGRKGSDRFASNILNLSLVALGILAILATVFAPQVMRTQTFTVDSQAEVFEVAVLFFRIFAVQLVFYGLGGVITGVLNANRIYGIPALAPMFNNVVIIIAMLAYTPLASIDPYLALIVLGAGTTLGVLVQFAIQIPTLVKMGFVYTPKIDLRDPALKEALRIAFPTLIYIAGTLVSFSCRNAFSLQSGPEGPATLIYAWTWYQLPYGVVAVSLSTAFLTEMSNAVARDDFDALRGYVRNGLRNTLFLIIPLAGLMIVLAAPIIQIQRAGVFSQGDVAYVSSILAAWVVSLPFYAGQMYLYRVFAALRQFMVFALVSCALCVVQVGLYALLCPPEMLGLFGVPVADLVYFSLQFIIMAIILKQRIGSFGMPRILAMCLKVLAATLAVMAVIYPVLGRIPGEPSRLTGLAEVAVFGFVGLAVVFALCKLLRVPEMDTVIKIIGKIGARLQRKQEASEPQRRELPKGKHARPDIVGRADTEEDGDDDWHKVGKHAAKGEQARARHAKR